MDGTRIPSSLGGVFARHQGVCSLVYDYGNIGMVRRYLAIRTNGLSGDHIPANRDSKILNDQDMDEKVSNGELMPRGIVVQDSK